MFNLQALTQILPISLVAAFLLASGAQGQDFEIAAQQLDEHAFSLSELESEHGRFGFQLVEPLQKLAWQQLTVNRYAEAAHTIDRAIQISRLEHGLYTPYQYDLLELETEITLRQHDWDAVADRLAHYTYLMDAHYQGDPADHVKRMLWLSDMHMRAALDDAEDKIGQHLIAASHVNEIAVEYSRNIGHVETNLYVDAVYSLVYKYYLEARGVLAGGSTALQLRKDGPLNARIERRGQAIERRFQKGLQELQGLRDLIQESPAFDAEAAAMAELYIADWHVLFDAADDVASQYQRSREMLRASGVSEERLQRFFATPANLPRPRLELSVADAMKSMGSPAPGQLAGELPHRLQLLEPSRQLTGLAQDLALLDWSGIYEKDWQRLTVTLTVDPGERHGIWNGGYRTYSRVTPREVVVNDVEGLEARQVRAALRRLRTLAFRPAQRDGEVLTTRIELDFLFHTAEQRSLTPALSADRSYSGQRIIYSDEDLPASLVAGGE